MSQWNMIGEDVESCTGEDGLPFLEVVDYRQYFFIIYWIVIFG
jgi:hypothetical protein